MVYSGDIRSVESFLKALAKSDKRVFLENYVFMFSSRSRQDADFQRPRAIMFSVEDEFVISFNADPSQEGGNQLEMMEFDRQKRAFKFFEVDFDKSPREAVSEVNPRRCLSCHKNDPRPNWEHYFFWPGMYGGIDDGLTVDITYLEGKYGKHFTAEMVVPFEGEKFRDLFESREGQEYMKFNRSKSKHPRYSHLAALVYPEDEEFFRPGPYPVRPGRTLTNLLHDLNEKRIQRKVEELIEVQTVFEYALIGAMLCRGYFFYGGGLSLEEFIPAHLRSGQKETTEYLQFHTELSRQRFERNVHRHGEVTGDDTIHMGRLKQNWPPYSANSFLIQPSLAPIKYVMDIAGLDMDDWSTSFSGISNRLTRESISILSKQYIIKATGGEINSQYDISLDLCREFASKSMEALRSVQNL